MNQIILGDVNIKVLQKKIKLFKVSEAWSFVRFYDMMV
jgi:hypothetical protein